MDPITITAIVLTVTSCLIKLVKYFLQNDNHDSDVTDFLLTIERISRLLLFYRRLRIQYRGVMTITQRFIVLEQETKAWDSIFSMERKILEKFGTKADGSLKIKSKKDGRAILGDLKDDARDAENAAMNGTLALHHQITTMDFAPELTVSPAFAAGFTHSVMVSGSNTAAIPDVPTTPVSPAFPQGYTADATDATDAIPSNEWSADEVMEAADRFGSLVVSGMEVAAAIAGAF